MDIRNYLLATCFFLNVYSQAQSVETQRKYTTDQIQPLFDFILSSGQVNVFKTKYHARYVYSDLYLDTPESDLAANGLSLRFRKKNEGVDSVTYVFQLKTEMQSENGIRLEIDEPELDFYILTFENNEISLAELLDDLFEELTHGETRISTPKSQKIIETISNWIIFKAGAPIAPFQKLRFLFPALFTHDKIATLSPVVYGVSKRFRSHIYVDSNDSNPYGLIAGRMNGGSEIPTFFQEHSSFIWLMESSIDSAVFYPVRKSVYPTITIVEYELENKFGVDSISTILMNDFEGELKSRFSLTNTLDSKYLQSVKTFGKN
jgi:hypothetical protein